MEITINEKTIKIKNSFRAMLVFERLQESLENQGGLSQLIQYFWCCVIASKEGSEIDYNTFLTWLDENPDKLTEFSKWLETNRDLIPKKN